MNIETAAQAIHASDMGMSIDNYPWSEESEDGKTEYREFATAAIDAYRTLTDDQWEAQREYVGRTILQAMGGALNRPPHHNLSTDHAYSQEAADSAMTALGFRRAGDQP